MPKFEIKSTDLESAKKRYHDSLNEVESHQKIFIRILPHISNADTKLQAQHLIHSSSMIVEMNRGKLQRLHEIESTLLKSETEATGEIELSCIEGYDLLSNLLDQSYSIYEKMLHTLVTTDIKLVGFILKKSFYFSMDAYDAAKAMSTLRMELDKEYSATRREPGGIFRPIETKAICAGAGAGAGITARDSGARKTSIQRSTIETETTPLLSTMHGRR